MTLTANDVIMDVIQVNGTASLNTDGLVETMEHPHGGTIYTDKDHLRAAKRALISELYANRFVPEGVLLGWHPSLSSEDIYLAAEELKREGRIWIRPVESPLDRMYILSDAEIDSWRFEEGE